MNKVILQLVILFTVFGLNAQNVIKVRSQHSKELIHVMNNEAFYGRGESKIHIRTTSVGYEFITRNEKSGRYKLYKDGKVLGEFPNAHFSDDKHWETSIKRGDENLYTLNFKNGQKFGPYQYVHPYFSEDHSLIGIRYKENGKVYFKNVKTNKLAGPHDEIYVQKAEAYNITYEYRAGNEWFLFHNNDTYGPYQAINCPYSYSKDDPFYFTFQNKNDEWQVFYKNEQQERFTNSPAVTIYTNGKFMINGDLKTGEQVEKCYLVDGKKYKDYYYDNSITTNSFGDVLELKAKKESGDTRITEIYMDGQLFGEHQTTTAYHSQLKNTSIFNLIIKEPLDMDSELFSYSVIKDKKKTEIGRSTDIDIKNLYFIGNDVIYIRNSDSTLIINGKETEHKKVTYLDYSSYPSEVYMIKKEGRNDAIYKNGKELTSEQDILKTRFHPDWYSFKYEDYTAEFIDGKKYIYLKNSNKKIGPVNSGSTIMFTSDKKHYAESDDRRMQVFLDGKLISDGFNIAYDPKTNAFHWLSIDDKKMYLHTYQNN